jgi:NAD(P)-dependent dehydrogenase (short-subunit alcohol dehydrogenase family)
MEAKTIIITGGAQGIGKAIAKKFLSDKYHVVIADLDEEAGLETEREYAALGGIKFMACDVASQDDVKAMIEKTNALYGRLDVLVNNAAINIIKPPSQLTLEEWNAVISVNLTGPFLCAKYAAPLLTKHLGVIINIASTRALMSEPHTEAYSASKGGILTLTHALAASLGPFVRVNCISPGWIEVASWKKSAVKSEPVLSSEDHSQHLSGRVGEPDDIARMAAFLASSENSFITGANFIIDGGMTHKMIYV